jgi:hypothetical protein
MFDRLTRSYHLLQQSLAVLLQDPELLLFPLLSGLAFTGVGAAFLWPAIAVALHEPHGAHAQAAFGPAHYALLFCFYVATYFAVAFFNVALVACAGIRLRGGDPTVGDGFSAAFSRIGQIFAWVVLAATVGTALHAIEDRAKGFFGKLITGLVGMAWSLATALVVPVLAFEQVGPVDALKRSMELMKRTWGEELVGNAGLGLLTTLSMFSSLALVAVGLVLAPNYWPAWVGGAVALIGLAAIVQSALHGIFQAAVYAYATSGAVPAAFSSELVTSAYARR